MPTLFATRVNIAKGQTGSDPCSALPSGKISFEKGIAILNLDDATYKRCAQFAAERQAPYGCRYTFSTKSAGPLEQTVVTGHVSTLNATAPHHPPTQPKIDKPNVATETIAPLVPVPDGFVNLQEACKIARFKPRDLVTAIEAGNVKTINHAQTPGEPEAAYFSVADLLKLKKGK